jgi:hypothetical protein
MYKWYIKRAAIKDYLWLRSIFTSAKQPANIYYATIQKTGSQWIKAVFGDPRIEKRSGLKVFPQYRYEEGEFKKRFPSNTFVPGLYISPALYREIKKPYNYRTFYVIRDPRDIVVSWYYSTRDFHPLMGQIGTHREQLKELNFEDGIAYCIKELSMKFNYMRNWYYEAQSEECIKLFKFEELTADPINSFDRIFEHCKIDVERKTLEIVLQDYSKERMRKRDLENKETDQSHYREKASKWEEAFNKQHIELFQDVNGDLLDLLDYEDFDL